VKKLIEYLPFSLITPGGKVNVIRLGLFSRSGFTREVEELGKKGEVELVDIRKIGL
jgi:hypothetical protein